MKVGTEVKIIHARYGFEKNSTGIIVGKESKNIIRVSVEGVCYTYHREDLAITKLEKALK